MLGNRSEQWLFLCKAFPIRFIATDLTTVATIVTLQISLHCSTYKVFKSHVTSSQADFKLFFNYELPEN
jgi:hypothetical protein